MSRRQAEANAEYDGADPAGFVDSQNLHRRHLSVEQRNERWAQLRRQGMSYRKIAEAEGVHPATVLRAVRDEVLHDATPEPPAPAEPPDDDEAAPERSTPTPPTPAKVTGRDGKQYAAMVES